MGVHDGRVVGVTKIVNHGPDDQRWNLVVMSEGYLPGDLPQFALDAAAFAQKLFLTKPFDAMARAINVFRIDVESTDRGADDPFGNGCTGSGARVDTFFDATFCGSGIPRLIDVDRILAHEVAIAQVPKCCAIVMMVNSLAYGGSGYFQIATCSRHADADNIALHELGHSSFALADEYVEQKGTYPGQEPAQPNIALDTGRPTLKWKQFVKLTTPLPTMVNPNCSQVRPSPPVLAGTIGAFEGADGYECNLFRPSSKCKMNDLHDDFCVVCQQQIRSVLAEFMPRT